jgi:V/A-type H+/Na+-transporting ATPase subunit F
MKLAALCDKDTAVGLRLAGIQEIYVSEGNEVKLWNQISERDDIGIVFINEKIAEDLDKDLKEYRLRNNVPIIIEIPDKKGRRKDHVDFVSHLIKKAVGVEINK